MDDTSKYSQLCIKQFLSIVFMGPRDNGRGHGLCPARQGGEMIDG